MKKKSPLLLSLITRKIKEKEVHQVQGSLLLEILIEGMEETRNHHKLNCYMLALL